MQIQRATNPVIGLNWSKMLQTFDFLFKTEACYSFLFQKIPIMNRVGTCMRKGIPPVFPNMNLKADLQIILDVSLQKFYILSDIFRSRDTMYSSRKKHILLVR